MKGVTYNCHRRSVQLQRNLVLFSNSTASVLLFLCIAAQSAAKIGFGLTEMLRDVQVHHELFVG